MTISPLCVRTILKGLLVVLGLGLAMGGLLCWRHHRFRYVWPRTATASMIDLQPLDNSRLQRLPAPWSSEISSIQTATPEGMVLTSVEFHTNSINMDFIRVDPGTFYMVNKGVDEIGAQRSNPVDLDSNQVRVSQGYYLGAFEVTNKQFELFDPTHIKRRPRFQRGKTGDNHPAQPVTWREAQEFARWLSLKEGRIYRLPTEAEWELACRAGTSTRLYWGHAFWDRTMANLGGLHSNKETAKEDGYLYTSPIGTFPANPWGFYDMIGNAYEWVNDWFHEPPSHPVTDPRGPSEGNCRMGKGGSWTTRPYGIFSAERDGNNPADLADDRGFRLLCELNLE